MELYLRYGNSFAVPAAVADHFLKIASHDQLKILLWLLAHAEAPIDMNAVTKACNVTADAVEEALVFWENVNVLHTAPQSPEIRFADAPAAVPAPVPAAPQPVPAAEPRVNAVVQSDSSRFRLSNTEIEARRQQEPALAEIMLEIERRTGSLVNYTAINSIIWMMDYLGMTPDVLLMLVDYCLQIDAFTPRYLEQIARDWHDRGVTSHEQVAADIQRRQDNRSYTGQVMKLCEMTRRPTAKQQKFIDSWQQMGMSIDLLRLAYEKTRDNLDDKLNFDYMNKIIEGWQQEGVTTVADAQARDESFYAALLAGKKKTKKPGGSKTKLPEPKENTSFDLSDFEQLGW